ncbi:MAG: hypothetical protein ACR2HV_01865 [Acidimicrobiales bacterium]
MLLFEPILATLEANGVRSVVVGGVATVLAREAILTEGVAPRA